MNPDRPLHVLVATPLGEFGQGGIDRLMDTLRGELENRRDQQIHVTFGATRGKGSILLSPLVLSWFLISMARCRLAGRLDVVHINLASDGSTYRKLVVSAVAQLLGVATVVHLHGGGYRRFLQEAPNWLRKRVVSMLDNAAQIVVLGRVWADFITEIAPHAANRIAVLPNASPTPTVGRIVHDGPANILFLGRLGPEKGIPELCLALAKASESCCLQATLAGDGAVESTRGLVARLGKQENISVLGWIPPGKVQRLMAQTDILVLPSHTENLPMVIIEAMAAGAAVVATPVGAVEEVIKDGETGLLVPVGNVDALSAAITRLIKDAPLRERLTRAAKALHRQRLDIAPYTARLIDIWRGARNDVSSLHVTADKGP